MNNLRREFTQGFIHHELIQATIRRKKMLRETDGGETLDTIAERAFMGFMEELNKQLKASNEDTLELTVRDVFLAGYMAGEGFNK